MVTLSLPDIGSSPETRNRHRPQLVLVTWYKKRTVSVLLGQPLLLIGKSPTLLL